VLRGLLCLVAIAGCPRATSSPAAPAAGSAEASTGESLGPLRTGLDERAVVAALGAPRDREPPIREEASGEWITAWHWPSATVVMFAHDANGPWSARSLTVTAPSTLATKRGIHVGSTRAEVARAYPRSADDDGHDPNSYLAGSMYDGVLFTFRGDAVTSIAVGPFAF
jgi:hypothetical protein